MKLTKINYFWLTHPKKCPDGKRYAGYLRQGGKASIYIGTHNITMDRLCKMGYKIQYIPCITRKENKVKVATVKFIDGSALGIPDNTHTPMWITMNGNTYTEYKDEVIKLHQLHETKYRLYVYG